MITLYHHPGFAAPLGDHVMPIRKFQLVADALAADPRFSIQAPTPITDTDLLRVHTPAYVEAIRTGTPRDRAESQKFPWSPALDASVRLTNGGVLAAATAALTTGISGALASGFHHAHADHGEGFCTFNGLIIAIDTLLAAGKIRTAAILDLDLHYGNGTATLAESRPHVFALSIYGNDYWNNVPHADVTTLRHPTGPHHESAILPNDCDGPTMLAILEANLPRLFTNGKPDLLLYQAGADPLRDDPYSPLDLGPADLAARDHRVFKFARDHAIPIAWVLAGGYTPDVGKVVQVHVNTAHETAEIFATQRKVG
jgi:acetoin utilization deacetylase AcuC-like enzyme